MDMMVFNRGAGLAIGVLVLCLAGAAGAQENLDQGKTPAQLFASDCAICHKSPQGLAKSGGISGLDGFLREHYTASRESAAAIAAYLQGFGNAPAAPAGRATKKGTGKTEAKGDDKPKAGAKKTETKKSGVTLPGDNTPPPAKTSEPKTSEPKSSDSKPSESKASDTKAGDSKPSESKAPEPKASDTKASEPKASDTKESEPKPAQSPKSD
jgi:hypothetical protein